MLNEPQATSLITLMINSGTVAEIKFRLVDAFYRMKDQMPHHPLQTCSAGLEAAPKISFSALALHQARTNNILAEVQQLLADELKLLCQEHEELEARFASLAALLEGLPNDT